MPAGIFNIKIEQGTTFALQLTLRDTENKPVDLTGWTGVGQVRRNFTDAAPTAVFTVAFKEPRIKPNLVPEGIITVSMPVLETWKFTPDAKTAANVRSLFNFVYDLILTKPDSTIVRVLEGTVEVSRGATKL